MPRRSAAPPIREPEAVPTCPLCLRPIPPGVPQSRHHLVPKLRGGKGGERAQRSSGQTKKVDPADQVSVVGADGPAVTSGAKTYDQSWIPAGHLQRPEAKRVGSGRTKSRQA